MVERRKELEGKSLAEVEKVIRREEGVDGVVVAVVGSGQRYKLKTRWWERRTAVGKERVERMSKPDADEENYGDDAAANTWAAWRDVRWKVKLRKFSTRGQCVACTGLSQDFALHCCLRSQEW